MEDILRNTYINTKYSYENLDELYLYRLRNYIIEDKNISSASAKPSPYSSKFNIKRKYNDLNSNTNIYTINNNKIFKY